jgi:hypothetical protein
MKRQGKSPNRKPGDGDSASAKRSSSKKFRFGCPCRDGCEPLPGFNPAKTKPSAKEPLQDQPPETDLD